MVSVLLSAVYWHVLHFVKAMLYISRSSNSIVEVQNCSFFTIWRPPCCFSLHMHS